MGYDMEREDKGNIDIGRISKREFGNNEFMVGFNKGVIDKLAGNTKAGNWKVHFKEFRKNIKR